MTRGLLLALVALATVACGGDTDRSMEAPRSGPTAPPGADETAADGDEPVLDGAAEGSSAATSGATVATSVGGDSDIGDGTGATRTGASAGQVGSPDRTGPASTGPGTAFSPFPSPPPEGVATTLFPVEFAMRLPWEDGEEIPQVYTCDGRGQAREPLIAWFPPPRRTVELALVVVDEDANDFVHWVATGIEPGLGALAPNAQLGGLVEAENGFGDVGWGPPCPPRRHDEHTYRFTLHAAGERIDVDDGSSTQDVIAAIRDASFRSVSITGVYDR